MSNLEIITIEQVDELIHIARGQKIILDEDLARLYEVETKVLNKAVRRHLDRFPKDFMFQLTLEEYRSLKFQNGTSKHDISRGRGGRRKPPFAFTEQGVAMLSSALSSPRAVQVNIAIMRTFVRLRQVCLKNRALIKKLEEIEIKLKGHDKQFEVVFEAMSQLLEPERKLSKRRIGFRRDTGGQEEK